MNSTRLMTTALLVAALSALSCGSNPFTLLAGHREVRPEVSSSPASEDARDAARVLETLHTGLLPDEIRHLSTAIAVESRRAGIPMELVLALIQVESSGNAFVVSSVGAIGLMQLRPSTAEEVANGLGIRWTGAATLFEPVTNVRLGVEYLRQLIERYDDVPTALAAYNWGPGRIGGKLRRGEAIPAAYSDKVMSRYGRPISSAI